MLGLAASDLFNTGAGSLDLKCSALSHRVKAMKSIEVSLAKGLHTFEEANAMLAACLNLLFQTCHFDDGLAEFMTLMRGIIFVTIHMGCHKIRFLFDSLLAENQLAKVEPGLKSATIIDSELVHAAISSLESFEPLCQREYEKSFFSALLQTARTLLTSSRDCNCIPAIIRLVMVRLTLLGSIYWNTEDLRRVLLQDDTGRL
jgi:hypothetical protein